MARFAVLAAVAALAAPAGALAGVNPQIAGLQVALRAHGLYLAQIDGVAGARTAAAVQRYNLLDQYAMGLVDQTQVPPFFLSRTRRTSAPLAPPRPTQK